MPTKKPKGIYTAAKQKGLPGHCLQAQVFKPNGQSLCSITPTRPASKASKEAELIAEVFNVVNITKQPPFEMKREINLLKTRIENRDNQIKELSQKTTRFDQQSKKMREVIECLLILVKQSTGVHEYHHTGEIATWAEFEFIQWAKDIITPPSINPS